MLSLKTLQNAFYCFVVRYIAIIGQSCFTPLFLVRMVSLFSVRLPFCHQPLRASNLPTVFRHFNSIHQLTIHSDCLYFSAKISYFSVSSYLLSFSEIDSLGTPYSKLNHLYSISPLLVFNLISSMTHVPTNAAASHL